GVARPADVARLRVERVELAVVGADVDGGPGATDRRHGRGGAPHPAGLVAPREAAVARSERVDEAVEAADVHAPVRDGRGRVEAPRAQAERAAGAVRAPQAVAVGLADRLDLAAVVAEEQLAVLQGQPALDRA